MGNIVRLSAGLLMMGAFIIPARADLRPSYGLGPTVFGGAGTSSVRGIAVNNNAGSPYEGFVYVTDTGSGAGNNLRRILIFRPDPLKDRHSATSYADTGWTVSIPGADQLAPFGVFVDSSDTIWMADYGARKIYTSAHPDAGNPTITAPTLQITISVFDAAAKADLEADGGPSGAVTPGSPRNLWVVGTPNAATVLTSNYAGAANNSTAQSFAVTGGTATSAGTATHNWSRYIGSGAGPYGITADGAGNVYVPEGPGAGGNAIRKYSAAGVRDAGFSAPLPTGIPGTVVADVAFVADPGGDYLAYSARFGTSSGTNVVLRYSTAGAYLDGYGPAATGTPNYTTLTLAGSTPSYMAADRQGNVYQRTIFGSNSGVRKVFRRQPFVVASAAAASAGGSVKSAPTAVDAVVAFGSDDGKLYAYSTADGNPAAGFPVDVAAATEPGVKIQSRASVYFTLAGKGIYFTTNRGDVGRVNGDGTGLTLYSGHASGANNVGTPAVTPDGTVYVGVNGAGGVQVVKLNADMTFNAASPALAPASGSISSVAVNGANVYVGLTDGATGDIVVLKASDLTPQAAGVAGGEGVTAPPFVSGMSAYMGTLAGNFYKVNSVTFAADPTFGSAGKAAIGEPLPGSAFNSAGVFYVGSGAGKVWQVNALDGSFNVLYDTEESAASIPGLVANDGALAFGTNKGKVYRVPVATPTSARIYGGYGALTTPTLDRDNGKVLIGSDDKNVYVFGTP